MKVIEDKVKDWARKKWTDRWDIYKAAIPSHQRTPAQEGLLIGNRLDYHSGLRKAESSMAIQLRSGKNGFNHFLHKMKVPGVHSARCSCGWAKQDAKHVLLYCPELSQQRPELLKEAGTHDVRTILTESKGIRAAARWMVKSGWLGQYRLAKEQLSRTKLPLGIEPRPKAPKEKKQAKRKQKAKVAELPTCCRNQHNTTEVILVE